jgi:hypothetical protein
MRSYAALAALRSYSSIRPATWYYRVPASYALPEFFEAGGLTSYGTNFGGAYRQAGVYGEF